MFNESDFLSGAVTGSLDTVRPKVPKGQYRGIIKELKTRQNAGQKDPSKMYTSIDLMVELQLSPEAQQEMNTDQANITRRYGFLIDLTPDGKGLDMGKGKNVDLGRVREALGQNDPAKPWKPLDLVGQIALWKVDHRPNKDKPGEVYDEIVEVGKL